MSGVRSNSVDIPDFTRGAWKNNAKVKLTLRGGWQYYDEIIPF
ncbi:hypothetical protein [Sphingobacterium kitahiroshimense]|uniref:Uncharacterized protein n=1 Tax=Sphingobacterium kitahiroshimense TaxID=470446 RepID=A0ABV0C1A1_9SPHI